MVFATASATPLKLAVMSIGGMMGKLKDRMRLAFEKARTHLAQIASVRYTLQTIKDNIVEPCSQHYVKTPKDVKFHDDNLTKEIQELFEPFASYYDNFKPDYTCGHLFNMAVVLTADSALQVLLDNIFAIFKEKKGWGEDDFKQSIGWKKAKLKNSVYSKIESLFGADGLIKKNSIAKQSDSIMFLEQLRHLVTHCGGVVDKDFYLNCGVNPTTKKSDDTQRKVSLMNLPDSIEEKDISAFCDYFKLDAQVGIPIEKLIRILKEVLAFTDEIEKICQKEI